jgi:4-hydroxybenzoate polyprenyltransferase
MTVKYKVSECSTQSSDLLTYCQSETFDESEKVSIAHHLHTIWLFGSDQIYDVVIPCSALAISGALSGSTLGLPSLTTSSILLRLPLVVVWLWLMALQFCLSNQLHPKAVEEDAINKPWRPLPAKRISFARATQLLYAVYLVNGAVAYGLGVLPHWVAYSMLVIAYNDFGGSDHNGLVRTSLTVGGYVGFFSSAMQVALGTKIPMSLQSWKWIGLIIIMLFTTFHAQEFRDEKGDAARERRTVLTAIGNTPARYVLIGAVAFWSLFIPIWFGVFPLGALGPVTLGMSVVGLTVEGIGRNDEKLDRMMYKLWTVWMLSFTPMPLLRQLIVG